MPYSDNSVHQLFLSPTLDISFVGGTPASLATPQVTELPAGCISGHTSIFEKIPLFCLQELPVIRLEPVDVDFDHLGGVDGRPFPHQLLCLNRHHMDLIIMVSEGFDAF